jgi:hypothetical protein
MTEVIKNTHLFDFLESIQTFWKIEVLRKWADSFTNYLHNLFNKHDLLLIFLAFQKFLCLATHM